jgi:hypothetical protein
MDNQGDGTFLSGAHLPRGTGLPRQVLLGDVDGDLVLDVAFADRRTVPRLETSIRVGLGTGSSVGLGFEKTTEALYETAEPTDVLLVDLDGDTTLDLGFDGDYAPNDGAGSFGDLVPFAAGTGQVTGDLDGDGDVDSAGIDVASDSIGVRLGDGFGGFAAPEWWSAGNNPSDIALGDLDGDGNLDLVFTNDPNVFTDDVGVLFGDGAGNFADAVYEDTGGSGAPLALGDLDSDGDLDLVTGRSGSPDGTLTVSLNDGSGALGPPSDVSDPMNPFAVVLDDLDGDSDLDVVMCPHRDSGLDWGQRLAIFANDGSAGLTLATYVENPVSGPTPAFCSMALSDIDGDGALDIVSSDSLMVSIDRSRP